MKRFNPQQWKIWFSRWRSPTGAPGVMSSYRRWQHQFFHQRLRLLICLCLVVLASFVLYEVCIAFTSSSEGLATERLVADGLIGGGFVLGLGLQATPWGRRHPGVIFCGISGTLTLTLLGQGIVEHELNEGDVGIWTMMFLAQSTLVPVRWKVHLRSQLTLLIPLTLLIMAIAIAEDFFAVLIGSIPLYIYLLWVCFIANLSVYLYERLRYAEFEARQATQTFLHAVSHDLRNPVTGTQLLLKSFLNQPSDTITIPRKVLQQMLQGGERQLTLINSLLEAHHNDLKGLALQRHEVPLHTLVESVCQEVAPLLTDAQASTYNQIDPNLPSVYGDSTQLWRVFHNLIINALHHNPPGIAVWVKAALVTSTSHPHIHCTVRDNGVGMTPAQRAQIFSLYVQGGHLRRHLSIGLGLYIAQQIIDAHGGRLGVDSEIDQGSTFWFTLPLYP
ncbi:MAG: HAMP domain-containing histidine kinase [Leptolyngbya sp. SIO1E4]|nr:HAMP domain-containing histidine kinase [Leptolyngbya sp. SIO1E4]